MWWSLPSPSQAAASCSRKTPGAVNNRARVPTKPPKSCLQTLPCPATPFKKSGNLSERSARQSSTPPTPLIAYSIVQKKPSAAPSPRTSRTSIFFPTRLFQLRSSYALIAADPAITTWHARGLLLLLLLLLYKVGKVSNNNHRKNNFNNRKNLKSRINQICRC